MRKFFYISILLIIPAFFVASSLYSEVSDAARGEHENNLAAPSETLPSVSRASILFVGDMMFDRHVRTTSERRGDLYREIVDQDLYDLIRSADYAVGNLEGSITKFSSKSAGTSVGNAHNTTFTFAPESASALAYYGFDAVSLANNHALDFGAEGVKETRLYLGANDIRYFGDPLSHDAISYTHTVDDIAVSFVGYNQFGSPGEEEVLLRIKELESKSDFTIVVPHWGREYTAFPTTGQQELARRFVDAGADAVIGAHSHVLGVYEEYKDTPIFYSLGNFIFDQYFSPDVRCGALLTLHLEKESGTTRITEWETAYSKLVYEGKTISSTCGTLKRLE